MRSALAALLLASCLNGRAYATPHEDPGELDQTIRTASRLEAVARFCPTLIPTDINRARTYAQVFIDAAMKADNQLTPAIMPVEMKRRTDEVQITGELRWCEDQRRFLKEVGAADVFPATPSKRRR